MESREFGRYGGGSVAQASGEARAEFIRKTYFHLAFAILAFIGVEFVLFQLGADEMMMSMLAAAPASWLLVLGGFMIIGWMSNSMATRVDNPGMQYLGLALYVFIYGLIFLPILSIAIQFSDPSVIPTAAILTGAMFAGLTSVAFLTRKDFSFLRPILMIGGFVALGFIVCGVMFGFNLGLGFSVAMVLFASGAILYDTSNIIHHYRTDQHVAASLSLFGSVALLFYYILRIVMSRR